MAMRQNDLSPPQQAFALHARFPEATGRLKAGRLVWNGILQPTPLSRKYRVGVTYLPRSEPRVRVLDKLATRESLSLPHVYSDGTLCLHESGDWSEQMFIVESIIPWTAEWLVNYEIWLANGEWYGGGEWPPRRRDDAAENATAGGEDSAAA